LATVITNLLSAIPVFGKDLVELIWTKDVLNFNLIIYIQLISSVYIGFLINFYVITKLKLITNKLRIKDLNFLTKISIFF